jgi:hypothetical protein
MSLVHQSFVHGFQFSSKPAREMLVHTVGGAEALLRVSRWKIGCLAENISISMGTAAERRAAATSCSSRASSYWPHALP